MVRYVSIAVFVFASMATVLHSADHDSGYFPSGAWGEAPGFWTEADQAEFNERWYGDQLAAMNEEPLRFASGTDSETTYVQLLFLPSFTPGSMLRLSYLDGRRMDYVFKQLDGAGGYAPGQVRRASDGNTDEKTAKEILVLMDLIDPWGGGTPTQILDRSTNCRDGIQTVLEIVKGPDYKVISRHECEMGAEDPVRRLINVLNDLSGKEIIMPQNFETPKN